MTGGALAVLLTAQISLHDALLAVDLDVMLFLFAMFITGRSLVASGYLYYLSYHLFSRVRSTNALVLFLLLIGGLTSALLMNDTLAIIGTPLVLRLAREHRIEEKLLLLALALGITIGSVMSPIGNPQNLLIAIHGHINDPFITFFQALAIPTLINLLLAYAVLRWMFRGSFHAVELVHQPATLMDPQLARLARYSLWIIISLVGIKILSVMLFNSAGIKLSYIAVAGALPILLFSSQRISLVKTVDWATLVFFIALFVLMASVWQSGLFQTLIENSRLNFTSVPVVMSVSLLLSQLFSNVPLTALYLPLLDHANAPVLSYMALAAGSTIAGNLLVLGAASNVIIIQNAEQHGATLSFVEFARIGIPVAVINISVYWGYFYLIYKMTV